MSYHPVFLDLRDRSCLIVGGGEVALRRGDRGRVDALLREHAGPGWSLDALGVEIG